MNENVAVAGAWELSWNTPLKESELWNFMLREYNIPSWFMFPITGIQHGESRSVNLHERKDMVTILEETSQQYTPVYFEIPNKTFGFETTMLKDFVHPDNALYMFGSSNYSPYQHLGTPEDIVVTIPTPTMTGLLWPHQCLGIALHDRLVKSGA